MSLAKTLGRLTGREFHKGLFSSPSDNAAQAASTTAAADNSEIANEESYVNTAEGNLRDAIGGLGQNPYFTPPAPPAAVNAGNTANFSTPAGAGTTTDSNMFAPPPQSNMFAAPQQRQAQPVTRAPATAA